MNTLLDQLFEVMRSMKPPGDLIYAKVAGSHSHNTNIPSSDFDALGIYVAPKNDVLGLAHVKDTLTNSTNDFTIHEVGKFCGLLLKGNPQILEMLFTERHSYVTGQWEELRQEKMRFLSQRVLKQYLGYLNAQMNKLEKGTPVHTASGKYNTKFAYHFLRLGQDAERIATGEPPVVWKEGPERDLLLNTRKGVYSEAQVIAMAKHMIANVESKKPWPIPEEGDRDWLNDWLLRVRELNGNPIQENETAR